MMTLNDMVPAIGGLVFGVSMYLYALHIRNKLRRDRAKDMPAE